MLNVNLGKHGFWVINKQAPNQQIWWSSPISGPRRYEHLSIRDISLPIEAARAPSAWVWTGKMNAISNGPTISPSDEEIVGVYSLCGTLHQEVLAATGVDMTKLV